MNRIRKSRSAIRNASPWTPVALAAALVTSALAPAGAEAPAIATLGSESRLWLEGNSTVHRFESTATKFEVRMSAADVQVAPGLEGLEQLVRAGRVKGVDVSIPVAEMRSGKNGLDKNMRNALKADRYPSITFRLERYALASSGTADSVVIDAHGVLAVAGVEKPVDIQAGATRAGNALRIRGSKELRMTEFEIKPPTMMMGTLRTSDQIVIRFDLLMSPSPSTPAVGMKGE